MYASRSIYEYLDPSLRGYTTCNTSGNMHIIFLAQSAELIFSKLFTKIYTSILLSLITIIIADPTDIDLTKTMKFIFNGNDYLCDELINIMFMGATSGNTNDLCYNIEKCRKVFQYRNVCNIDTCSQNHDKLLRYQYCMYRSIFLNGMINKIIIKCARSLNTSISSSRMLSTNTDYTIIFDDVFIYLSNNLKYKYRYMFGSLYYIMITNPVQELITYGDVFCCISSVPVHFH